jgi:hypothetical protein
MVAPQERGLGVGAKRQERLAPTQNAEVRQPAR